MGKYEVLSSCFSSSRLSGAVRACAEQKTITAQKNPFPKKLVERLDMILIEGPKVNGMGVEDVIFLGHLLFCVHTRSRWSDCARSSLEPVLVADEFGNDLYVEGGAHLVKTGNTAQRMRHLLPQVGLAYGIAQDAEFSWARSWLDIRRTAGWDAAVDGRLMPTPSRREDGRHWRSRAA